jgi:hypothetical protein
VTDKLLNDLQGLGSFIIGFRPQVNSNIQWDALVEIWQRIAPQLDAEMAPEQQQANPP